MLTIEPQRLLGDSATFGEINGLAAAGRYLLVIDRLADPHLVVLDLGTGQVVNRLVRHGRGPGEATQPATAQVIATDPPDAWIYDFGTRRLLLMRLTSPREEALFDELRLDVDVSLLEPNWVGGRLVANGLFVDQRLLVLDRLGRGQYSLELPPAFDAEAMPHPTGRRLMNRSFLVVSPARNRMAIVYQFGNRLDLLHSNGARLGSVDGPRATELKYRLEGDRFFWENGNQVAYSGAVATDRYLYALFSGNRLGDVEEQPSRLHVFEWNGDFVAEVALGGPHVRSIAVTPDDRRLYGGLEVPYPVVGEWDLSPLHERPID